MIEQLMDPIPEEERFEAIKPHHCLLCVAHECEYYYPGNNYSRRRRSYPLHHCKLTGEYSLKSWAWIPCSLGKQKENK